MSENKQVLKLIQIAKVIRSKNCSPFELTMDIIFEKQSDYLFVKDENLINKSLIAKVYNIKEEKIKKILYFDPALAVKITMARPIDSGAPGDTDVYGAQQHAPLLGIEWTLANK